MKVITLDMETDQEEPYTEISPRPVADGDSVAWEPEPKFPPLPLHVPAVISWLLADGDQLKMKYWARGESPEEAGLAELANDIRAARRLVTWNGRSFDMPLLSLRAMKFGVDWSFWEAKRHRFGNFKTPLFHYDLQDQLGDFGAARGLSLDRTAKLIGLPGKRDVCGADVAALMGAGELSRVVTYCCDDVLQTWIVYLAFCNSHLGAPSDVTQNAVNRTMAYARSHALLGPLYGG